MQRKLTTGSAAAPVSTAPTCITMYTEPVATSDSVFRDER